MVDVPRWNPVLVKQVAALGGVKTIFLTHKWVVCCGVVRGVLQCTCCCSGAGIWLSKHCVLCRACSACIITCWR
jgi:hypothetical protein